MRDLRDYWNWWKTRRSQIGALIILAGLIVWMNVALWQAERNYRGVLREMRRTYTQQEATREQGVRISLGPLGAVGRSVPPLL